MSQLWSTGAAPVKVGAQTLGGWVFPLPSRLHNPVGPPARAMPRVLSCFLTGALFLPGILRVRGGWLPRLSQGALSHNSTPWANDVLPSVLCSAFGSCGFMILFPQLCPEERASLFLLHSSCTSLGLYPKILLSAVAGGPTHTDSITLLVCFLELLWNHMDRQIEIEGILFKEGEVNDGA